MKQTHTVVVVSHQDMRQHENGNELINLDDIPSWLESHHVCKFSTDDSDTFDAQMRQVCLRLHAKQRNLIIQGRLRTREQILQILWVGSK